MLKLIKGGTVYAPEKIGIKDVLIAGDKIIKVSNDLMPPEGLATEVFDASGKSVVPGLIDAHIHITGAGGGGGFDSRSTPAPLTRYTKAGITTCVGCLGIDKIAFSLEELLSRVKGLEAGGLTAYMISGSYTFPSVTITGSLVKDLYLIDKVIGVKIALWETLASHPSEEALIRTISETKLGARLGKKAGVVVSHMGDIKGNPTAIPDLLDRIGIPNETFVMTHINRNPDLLKQTIACGKRGTILDLTGTIPNEVKIQPSKALRILLDGGVPLENITMTSDAGGALVLESGEGFVLPFDICIHEIRDMVKCEGFSLTDALKTMTINPARVYNLSQKGCLSEGKDADIVILDEALEVDTVFARGKLMLREKQPETWGLLERQAF
ncbi:isoaspartyl dipeptidase [Betaproteobacteria bacterium]|nr:isoaspartyl dipeptidase [Betaproteobacteria bacterium]